MTDFIRVTNLTVTGRAQVRDPSLQNVFITYNADFSVQASYELDFSIVNQAQTFGVPKSVFVDNGSNPSQIEVYVTNTDQYFVIPPYATGTYIINAAISSRLQFVSNGGATDIVTITIYNYEVPPYVWYSTGNAPVTGPQRVYGTMQAGVNIAAASQNEPIYIGGIDDTGLFKGLNVNTDGSAQVAAADGALVTIGAIADAAYTGAGSSTVIGILKGLWQSFFGVANDAVDSGNPMKIGAVAYANGVFPTITATRRAALTTGIRGALRVEMAVPGGAASPNYQNNIAAGMSANGWWQTVVSYQATYNGLTMDPYRKPNTNNKLLSSAATTNATNVKASAGDLFRISGRNNSATPRYLKLYNKATAPTVGTDVPVQTHYLPATSMYEITFDTPYYFSTGIGFAFTANAADGDNTAIAAGDIICQNLSYQ